jgi:hypothetical protein
MNYYIKPVDGGCYGVFNSNGRLEFIGMSFEDAEEEMYHLEYEE